MNLLIYFYLLWPLFLFAFLVFCRLPRKPIDPAALSAFAVAKLRAASDHRERRQRDIDTRKAWNRVKKTSKSW